MSGEGGVTSFSLEVLLAAILGGGTGRLIWNLLDYSPRYKNTAAVFNKLVELTGAQWDTGTPDSIVNLRTLSSLFCGG